MVMNPFKLIKAKLFSRRLKKAIEEADAITLKTQRKMLVLNWGGRPSVKAKGDLKQLIHLGFFKCDIQKLEQTALYKTY
mgnify:CR=1 FL=1